MSKIKLVARNIHFSYPVRDSSVQFVDVDFQVETGEVKAILGKSGTGKSTFMRILSGLEQQQIGDVYLETATGKSKVTQPTSPVSTVFQDYNMSVFPWLTVSQNILLGSAKIKINSSGNTSFDEIINFIFSETELTKDNSILNKYPKELSGGQRQRVQLSRALLSGANFLILDEPVASQDEEFKSIFIDLIDKTSHKFNVGIVLITHDIEQALYLSNELFLIIPENFTNSNFQSKTNVAKRNGFYDIAISNNLTYNNALKYPEFIKMKIEIREKLFA